VSIGESAESFTPVQFTGKRVIFDDPGEMEKELDKEMKEEDKENRRKIPKRGANGEEATLTLREMIDSLSPKRNPLSGRKSLHVGSARGILGKRPIELDDKEEEEEERDGVKRLKGHNSPVKNIRMTRSTRRSMEQAFVSGTPSTSDAATNAATTPRGQGRFKDVDNDGVYHGVDFEENKPEHDGEGLKVDGADGRIHLQDFLNMTSIRFMELTTSKRRQTQMPTALDDGADDLSLERCVVSAACAVPMLSLYQHVCHFVPTVAFVSAPLANEATSLAAKSRSICRKASEM
jgi:kinetochore protein Spc7/SPC105